MAQQLRETAVVDGSGDATFTSPTDEQVVVVRVDSTDAVNVPTQVDVVGDTTQEFPITNTGADVQVSFAVGLLGETVIVRSPVGAAGETVGITWQWND